MENPQYILYSDLKRGLIPQILLMVPLGCLFFLGIKFNVSLLNLELPSYADYIEIAVISVMIAINIFLIYKKIKKENYAFYADRIEFSGKKPARIYLYSITGISFKKSFLDRLFNTATILLEPGFSIKNTGNASQVYLYVQRMVQYAKRG